MSTRNPPAHRYGTTALALFCAATLPGTARAQAIASPFGTISQRVDSTTMTVEYYRPSVRGRTIFGRLVRWGDLWTPGANWATTLEVDHDVQIENRPLPHGKYSLWLIPAQSPDSWTVVLSRSARRFHVVKPVPADDQLRFKVLVDSTPHTEVLTFSFPEVNREGATLQLRWAETAASLHLATELNRAAPAPAHPWSSYTGIYEVRGVGEDSTAPGFRYEIIERGTGLWVRATAEAVEPGLDTTFDLLPAGGDTFHPRQYKAGRLVGTEMDELLVFNVEGGVATGFEVRGIAESKVLGRAIRIRGPG